MDLYDSENPKVSFEITLNLGSKLTQQISSESRLVPDIKPKKYDINLNSREFFDELLPFTCKLIKILFVK